MLMCWCVEVLTFEIIYYILIYISYEKTFNIFCFYIPGGNGSEDYGAGASGGLGVAWLAGG